MHRAILRSGLACLILVAWPALSAAAGDDPPDDAPVYREAPDDGPARVDPRQDPAARSAGARVAQGPYVSIQVNVDAQGLNITGDAGNETSIAVNPTNPSNMVIGWRQFDNVSSNFRQGGWAYTFDGGQSWTFPGVLTPGIFRSDPVLAFDAAGTAYYQSLKGDFTLDVFESGDGGMTWGSPVPSFGGDKNWMAVDTTAGVGAGNIYGIWQRFFGCCGTAILTRSTDGNQSWEAPVDVDLSPAFGMMAVGPEGNVYMAGIDGTFGQDFSTIVVSTSTNAENAGTTPTSTGSVVPGVGSMGISDGPNPSGLLGQVNVAVDHSGGPGQGNVYMLASLEPGSPPFDPLDVTISRSEDQGATWSAPVRVNDDPPGNGAWHWFGTISVAPDGRIDVVWNDSRNQPTPNLAELFYAYSHDEGQTWSTNVAVSPVFDSFVGWPNQSKLGDYYTMVSDLGGAHVAYAATFNGEQDVYYLNVFPDCNGNGQPDLTDVQQGGSGDCNANNVPDECETSGSCVVAGATPDGKRIAGSQLKVRLLSGGNLSLTWGASCLNGDTDYGVYEGSLGGVFDSHTPATCTTGGAETTNLTPAAGSTYYLVVPRKEISEGSYGRDSAGDERPVGATVCRPQGIGPCGFIQP